MNENDRELLNGFVVESSELLEKVEETLLGLDEGQTSIDSETINEIFRAVHTVKGTCGFFGFEVIGRLSHVMENVLGMMREDRLALESDLVDALLVANDRLRTLVADPENSNEEDVSLEVAEIERWLAADGGAPAPQPAAPTPEPAVELAAVPASATEGADVPDLAPELRAELVAGEMHLYRFDLEVQRDLVARKRSVRAFFAHLTSMGQMVACEPSEEVLADAEPPTDRAFVLWLVSEVEPELAAMNFALPPERIEAVPVKAAPPAAPKPAEVKPPPPKPKAAAQVDTLRVKTSQLDRLMQMAGELVLTRNRLLRRLDVDRQQVDGLGTILTELNGITSEMQEQIMQTRLQPLGTVFGRFGRVVHDMSKALGKSVRLDTVGSDVELDKAILEGLTDPLTHMLRNSIDHGLEGPDDRERAGKPRQGVVRIHAYHEGGMVKIDVEDDGRGIDLERVRGAAIKRGLLSAEQAARLSDEDTLGLIFRPGFSTASKITSVSGRGVGMDVVRTNIEKLGGVVEASTREGEGSKLSIKLPLTLAIVTSLIVDVEGQRFALPQVGLESVVRLRPEEVPDRIDCIRDVEVLRYRDTLLPIVRLADVLGMERTYVDPNTGERQPDRRGRLSDRRRFRAEIQAYEAERRNHGTRRRSLANVLRILVLRIGRHRYGLLVDEIIENEEIVVKPLSRFLRECQCFSGATILGDGRIAMILDPVNIAQEAKLTFSEVAAESRSAVAADDAGRMERLPLIHFDAGGCESFAVPLSQVARVESVARDAVQRVGSRAFMNYRGKALPLVQLHEHLEVEAAAELPEEFRVIIPNLGGDAVGLVAHEVIDARDMEICLDEQTIRGPGLMGSAVVGEDIVLVLDTYELLAGAGIALGGPAQDEMSGRRALVVESVPFVRQATIRYLESVGVEVDFAEDGAAAWEAAQSGVYDVVITAPKLPKLDGVGLLARLRQSEALDLLPVIALAADGAEADQFDAYAQKLDRPELLRALQAVLQEGAEVAA